MQTIHGNLPDKFLCSASWSPKSGYMSDNINDNNSPDTDTDPASMAQEASAVESPEAQIAALVAERDSYHEKWLRSEAEMANLRNRTRREIEDARLYALQKFAADVAESAENLRRGLDALPKAESDESPIVTKMREGFESVERSFIAMLERHGVTAREAAGAAFDPNLHQAMAQQETADQPPGTVLQAWSRVWLLNNRLLKPAMVVVSKAPAQQDAPVEGG